MNETIVLETSKGPIEVELNRDKAPITVENFIQYVDEGFFEGLCFHRIIKGFMIQGGGFTPDGQQKKTRDPIQSESRNGLKNKRGTIAMARTSDPDSATSQFFINTANNTNLDYPSFDGHGYTVFGKVTSGIEVMDEIEGTPTGNKRTPYGSMKDWPLEDITLKKTVVK